MSGIKIGLTQVKRSLFEINYNEERWISARWCSVNPPIQDRIITTADFGTQDFNIKTEISHEEHFDLSAPPDSPDDQQSGGVGGFGSFGQSLKITEEGVVGAIEGAERAVLGEPAKPKTDFTKRQPYNYGFNDFVIIEFTPTLEYDIGTESTEPAEGQKWEKPFHPRGWFRTEPKERYGPYKKPYGRTTTRTYMPKACYTTMAYGWGKYGDVVDPNSTVNEYVDVEGPEPWDKACTDQPFVKLMTLPIPGGLANSDTFWVDLNKGVRALYFPARYTFLNQQPELAAYAKVSFVEDSDRNLNDATQMFEWNEFSKAIFDTPIDPKEFTDPDREKVKLDTRYHVGAYSTKKSLIINIPQFLETCYRASMDQTTDIYSAISLADSTSIKATRRSHKSSWNMPPDYFPWWLTQHYCQDLAVLTSKFEQVNFVEKTKSELKDSEELALNFLAMAASLIPYIGPLISTGTDKVIESLKNIRETSSGEEAEAAGISTKDVWEGAPDELKKKVIKKVKPAVETLLKLFHRK